MRTIDQEITAVGSAPICQTSGTINFCDDGTETALENVNAREKAAEDWTRIIDEKLINWGLVSTFDQEDELEPPSGESIAKACELAKYMRDCGFPLPTGVIPDGEGGIVYENRQGNLYQSMEIDCSGMVELLTFRDCKLVSRQAIDFGT